MSQHSQGSKVSRAETWDSCKDRIYDVYITGGNILSTTMKLFEREYGLKSYTRTWKSKLKEWKYDKYFSNVEEGDGMRSVSPKLFGSVFATPRSIPGAPLAKKPLPQTKYIDVKSASPSSTHGSRHSVVHATATENLSASPRVIIYIRALFPSLRNVLLLRTRKRIGGVMRPIVERKYRDSTFTVVLVRMIDFVSVYNALWVAVDVVVGSMTF